MAYGEQKFSIPSPTAAANLKTFYHATDVDYFRSI